MRKEVLDAVLPMFHTFSMTRYPTFGIRKQALLVLFPQFGTELVPGTMNLPDHVVELWASVSGGLLVEG